MEMSLFGESDRKNHLDPGYAIDPGSLVLNPTNILAPGSGGGISQDYYNALNPDLNATLVNAPSSSTPSFWQSLAAGLSQAAPGIVQGLVKPGTVVRQSTNPYAPGYVTPPKSSSSSVLLVVGIVVVIAAIIVVFIAKRK